jgi:hypothetical protein
MLPTMENPPGGIGGLSVSCLVPGGIRHIEVTPNHRGNQSTAAVRRGPIERRPSDRHSNGARARSGNLWRQLGGAAAHDHQ